jgi:hypothetical protein
LFRSARSIVPLLKHFTNFCRHLAGFHDNKEGPRRPIARWCWETHTLVYIGGLDAYYAANANQGMRALPPMFDGATRVY